MKFEIIFLSGFVIVLLIIFLLKKPSVKYTNVKVGGTKIRAEIADNFISQAKGLMFRKSLPEKEGMLFIFDEENYQTFLDDEHEFSYRHYLDQ